MLKVAAFSISMIAANAMAGGLYLYEVGTEDIGLAGAGQAARAQDAGTIAFNPAGMTRLKGDQFSLGLQALYGDVNYHLDRQNGRDPDNPVIGWFPGASGFYSHSIDERLKIGIGLYGNFGLGLKFGDWSGSALLRESTLIGMTIQPTLAYKLNDQWSLGLGIGANYGIFSQSGDRLTDEIKDTDWAFNGKLGVLYEPSQSTRFGLAYTSKTAFEYNVDLKTPLLTRPMTAQINAPQQVMVSAYHQLDPKLAILGNVGWQDWSAFGDSKVILTGAEAELAGHLVDTWHAAVGLQYQYTPQLRLNTGLAFDSSFYSSQSDGKLVLPVGDTWRLGVGAQYVLDNASTIGAAFEYGRTESTRVSSPALDGGYDAANLYFISINYTKKF
ncbi:OmpP1/FadL family transporter [Chitinilyticum litopenaei]|uniref:OmpP1/FadL family transporter n=1 Tax=Chitinilyticum litopenaei TaxID=1121276 RepID=UPI0005BD3A00|nr:outer membrane protein transport protein [Chitinilyticum litopenaei]